MDSHRPASHPTAGHQLETPGEAREAENPGNPQPGQKQLESEIHDIQEQFSAEMFTFARMFAGNAEVAEEALQEAYYRYLLTRARGNEVLNPKAWLLRVIHNLIVDWKTDEAKTLELNPDLVAPDTFGEEEEQRPSLGELLERTRGVLTPREQKVLHLRMKGLRYQEVAKRLGICQGSVSTYLTRAFRKLRNPNGVNAR